MVTGRETRSTQDLRYRDRLRSDERAQRTTEVLDSLDHAPEAERTALLEQLIRVNMGVAESIAARYRHRGLCQEDLQQVAYLALIRVAQHFDRSMGYDFMSYAVPSIRGEIRRHFRDHGWMVRPPRRVLELQSRIAAAEPRLCTELGHPPTSMELATHLGESAQHVQEAQSASGRFFPTSLEQADWATETTYIRDRVGGSDGALEAAEIRAILTPILRRLGPRDRLIIELRFFFDCTQQEIADEIGVTQMQVSRLLSGILRRLRNDLDQTAAAASRAGGIR